MKQVVVIISIMSSLFMFDLDAGDKIECERFSNLKNHYSMAIEPVVSESEFIVQDFEFSDSKDIKTVIATTKLGCGAMRGCTWGIYREIEKDTYCYLGSYTGTAKVLKTMQHGFYDFSVVTRGTAVDGSYSYTYSYNSDKHAYEVVDKQVVSKPESEKQ